MTIEVHHRGSGPERGPRRTLLMIHGSATDYTTWTVQFAGLAKDFCMLAYDRCATAGYTVERHADDAAEILRAEVMGPSAVVGSSFGAVVALDLARRYPDLVEGLVLCEPPLAESDYLAPVPDGFACRFDAIAQESGGPAASEFFLRSVLGNVAFDRMPKVYRQRSMAAHAQIRADMGALSRYRPRYEELSGQLRGKKVRLLGGERSSSFYRATLESLHAAIPGSELRILRGAGHMMHVDGHRQFAEVLRAL